MKNKRVLVVGENFGSKEAQIRLDGSVQKGAFVQHK